MMNQTNQSESIRVAINRLIDFGMTDKDQIYSEIVLKLGVPRPTVRRVARDLRMNMLKKVEILSSDLPKV